MDQINLSRTIIVKRREKGITQDQLAQFIGVTKASVSKWETGQSYPDITLLPQLAAYFNISIDELMGYEPQMAEDDIRKLYKELSLEFTSKPFEEVMTRCRDIVKKYYSCFPLLLQMGILYLNYGYYTITGLDDNDKTRIVKEAKELFLRVRAQSQDPELRHITLHMLATCELLLGNPKEVISIFKDTRKLVPATNEVLLSQAYLMDGKVEEAKTELQNSIYDNIFCVIGVIPAYMDINTDNKVYFHEIVTRTVATIDIWKADNLIPVGIIPFYLSAAIGYAAHGSIDKAIKMLEKYTEIATGDIFPLTMNRDDFFDLVTVSNNDLPFGIAETPRDEKTIMQSIVNGVIDNPAFEILHSDPRFMSLTAKLRYGFDDTDKGFLCLVGNKTPEIGQ
ncbi:MAG: helix-turn-helix domain-containing protein [Defluviitaleaceae bacterium]|nr:helix-turn-helix domain-containing protein [Defluviitaleaceae bacterium]